MERELLHRTPANVCLFVVAVSLLPAAKLLWPIALFMSPAVWVWTSQR